RELGTSRKVFWSTEGSTRDEQTWGSPSRLLWCSSSSPRREEECRRSERSNGLFGQPTFSLRRCLVLVINAKCL
ncbi:hypothetical protein IscW_ISCW019446, partial [Ixodes scapularis]